MVTNAPVMEYLAELPEVTRHLYLGYLTKWPESALYQSEFCADLLRLPVEQQIDLILSRFKKRQGQEKNSTVFRGPAQAKLGDLLTSPPPHEFIVEGMIPVTNAVLVAPGGVGKTTITVWEAIHLILGRDVWGHKVLRPGGVLFLTAEDTREDFMFRLYQLMSFMLLTAEEHRTVVQNIYVEDVTQRIVRLAELNRDGNIVMSPYVDELCDRYRDAGLAMVNIDPLSHFGPGERFVNDAEAVMCQVGRRLSDELQACVRLVHHTGKAVEREKIIDQYASRNGSALPDNSRLVMQLVVGDENKQKSPLPQGAVPLMKSGSLPLQMWFHKISYAEKPKYPIWLMRRGWQFKEFNGEPVNEIRAQKEDLHKIIEYLDAKLAEGVYCSLRKLQDDCTDIGLTKSKITSLVGEAVQKRELVYLDLPPDKVQGGFKTYLAPVQQEGTPGSSAAQCGAVGVDK